MYAKENFSILWCGLQRTSCRCEQEANECLTHNKLKLRLSSREVTTEKQQNDLGKLMLMRQEYERYKDLWGLNLHYSHSAGPTQNYSKYSLRICQNLSSAHQLLKRVWSCKWCTSTLTPQPLTESRRM